MLNRKLLINIALILFFMLNQFTGTLATGCSCEEICAYRNILENQHKSERIPVFPKQVHCSEAQTQMFHCEAETDEHIPVCCCAEDSETACTCFFETGSNNINMAFHVVSNSGNSDLRNIGGASENLNKDDPIFGHACPQYRIRGTPIFTPIYLENLSLLI